MPAHFNPEFDPADVNTDYGSTGGDITVPTFTADYSPFKFWCQKTLPLVFDDSLSYYEVLCKLVTYVNNLLADLQTATGSIGTFAQQFVVNQQFLNNMAAQLGTNTAQLEAYINDRMEDFSEAYSSLQEYVNTYFANLDVQEEINTKLDEMAQDGTLDTLLQPFTEDWLENMTEEIRTDLANQNQTLATQNSRISVLEGRMDTFAALPAGSTSGNAELLDIRTNFLGETFGSAGDAVRMSDLIASGYTPLAITAYQESTDFYKGYFDVTPYKGGRIAIVANISYSSVFFSLIASGLLSVSNDTTGTGGHYLEADPSEEYYYGNFIEEFYEKRLVAYTNDGTIYDSGRDLIIFKIKENFNFTYMAISYETAVTNPITPVIKPDAIVYGSYFEKTPVDDTLTQAGEAADAKAAGDAISDLETALTEIENDIFNTTNLLKFLSSGFTSSGMTVTLKDNNIKLNGTSTAGITIDSGLFDAPELKPSTTYTFRILNASGLTNSAAIYLRKGTTNIMSAPFGAAGQNGVTFTTPADISDLYWRLYIGGNVTYANASGNLMLVKGSTAPEVFIPYHFPVVASLDDVAEAADIVPLSWERGTIAETGENGTNNSTNIQNRIRTANIIHVKKGSQIKVDNNLWYMRIYFYDGYHVKAFDSYENIYRQAITYTFSTDSYIRVLCWKYGDPSIDVSDMEEVIHFKLFQANDAGIDVAFIGSQYNVLGDCTICKFPSGKVLMIDCWSEQEYYFSRALWQFGVTHIDYFILSHYHSDHMGNFHWLVSNGYIDADTAVYLPQALDTTKENVTADWDAVIANYESVSADITASGATSIIPSEGDVFCIDGYPIQFWNVDHTQYYPGGEYASTNYNDFSLCNYLFVGDLTLGFSGDLGWVGQEKCAATMLKCNIYKAQHHGYDNDPNHLVPAYINRVVPDVVFSEDCSRHVSLIDTAGSPMQTWCEANAVSNYRTYINGNMSITVNKNSWRLNGSYERYIRNGKNWSFSDNTQHIES